MKIIVIFSSNWAALSRSTARTDLRPGAGPAGEAHFAHTASIEKPHPELVGREQGLNQTVTTFVDVVTFGANPSQRRNNFKCHSTKEEVGCERSLTEDITPGLSLHLTVLPVWSDPSWVQTQVQDQQPA